MVKEAFQRMTIETKSKENDYSKHSNYFQSWQAIVITTGRQLGSSMFQRNKCETGEKPRLT